MDPKDQNKSENTEAAKNSTVGNVKQEKLKKAHEQNSREEEIKKMPPKELRKKLSNKNQDYVFRLEKFLAEDQNYTMDQVEPAIDQILPEIIVAQRKGIPASSLYQKAPREKAIEIANPKKEAPKNKFWMHAVDNGLLYFVIFAGFFGVVQLFNMNSKQQNGVQQMGILTVASVTILFGILMAYYNDLVTREKSKRPPMWKVVLIGIFLVGIVMVWITITSMPFLRVINPVLNPWVYIVLAVIAFFVRRWFRQKYHVVDPLQIKRENEIAARRRNRRS